MPRHLNRHMRRRAKTIKSQPPAWLDTRKPQAAESNDPRAKQWRGLQIGESFGNRVNEILRRNDIFGVATIDAVSSERRVVTKIFIASPAVFAYAIRMV